MEAITRDYLHVIFHCIFQHLFINKLVFQSCWDLACDIAVENAINDIGIQSLDTARQSKQMQVITQLKSSLRLMTAEKIYRYYLDKKTSEEELVSLRQNFYADNPTLWYVRPEKKGSTQESELSFLDTHLKRTLVGREIVLAVTKGELELGTWEEILYFEFDGKRRKKVLIKIIGE